MTVSDMKYEAKWTQEHRLMLCLSVSMTRSLGPEATRDLQLPICKDMGDQILQNECKAMIMCRTSASDLIKVPFYITKEGHMLILDIQSGHTFNLIKFANEAKTMDGVTYIKQT